MENKQKEFRSILKDDLEIRNNEETKEKVIKGYINKFNKRSQYMGFYEEVNSNAFDKTLNDNHNIYAMYNHDDNKILGSTRSGSLKLYTDEVGLAFELRINPNISYANDLYELVKNGDVDGCSFGFIVNEDDWSKTDDNISLRKINDVDLFEVTITPYPAYLDSQAECRSFKQYQENVKVEQDKQEELRKLELEFMELELN